MTEIQKPVRRSSLVMLSLFAAAAGGSGVAQAQECIAREKSFTVRAEGITEAVGTIELRCTEPAGFGFGSPAELEVTVELNTRITSVIDDDRVVAGLSYTDLSGTGVTDADFAGAKLSEDGTTITWEITSADVNLGTTGADGFQVTIGGIKANASAVGDGEDITAVVRVGGTAVHSAPLKVADVMLWRGIPAPNLPSARLAVGMGAHRVDRRLRLELRGRRADQRPSVEPLSREDPRLALDAESNPLE